MKSVQYVGKIQVSLGKTKEMYVFLTKTQWKLHSSKPTPEKNKNYQNKKKYQTNSRPIFQMLHAPVSAVS